VEKGTELEVWRVEEGEVEVGWRGLKGGSLILWTFEFVEGFVGERLAGEGVDLGGIGFGEEL
jgi:hypothetical protein